MEGFNACLAPPPPPQASAPTLKPCSLGLDTDNEPSVRLSGGRAGRAGGGRAAGARRLPGRARPPTAPPLHARSLPRPARGARGQRRGEGGRQHAFGKKKKKKRLAPQAHGSCQL